MTVARTLSSRVDNNIRLFAPKPRRMINVDSLCVSVAAEHSCSSGLGTEVAAKLSSGNSVFSSRGGCFAVAQSSVNTCTNHLSFSM